MTHQEWSESLTAEKYILNELLPDERDRFEEHYFECPECAEDIRRLSHLKSGAQMDLSAAVAKDNPQGINERSNWLENLWGWWSRPQFAAAGALAAAVFACVLGYQNVQLRNQLGPQAIESIVLMPATRGALPGARLTAAGALLLLEADLPAASGALTWRVQSSKGNTLFERSSSAPEPGSTFKILLPSAQVPGGEYTLAVRAASGGDWTFRFSVRDH